MLMWLHESTSRFLPRWYPGMPACLGGFSTCLCWYVYECMWPLMILEKPQVFTECLPQLLFNMGFVVCFVLLCCLRRGLLLGLEVTDWLDWPVNPEIHLFPSSGPKHWGYSHEWQRLAKYIHDGNPQTSLAGILPTKLSPQSLVNILISKWFWLLGKSHGYCRSYLTHFPGSTNGNILQGIYFNTKRQNFPSSLGIHMFSFHSVNTYPFYSILYFTLENR